MKNYKRGRFARRTLLGIVILIGVVYLNRVSILQKIVTIGSHSQLINIDKQSSSTTQNDELANLKYTGQTVVEVNHNQPAFSQDDLKIKQGGWQKLSSLDWLGRPQVANALLNQKLMPPSQKYQARERLTIKTPGYHAIKTGTNTTDWLYNRSHLIGYQFTGLNNEAKN
ncbi:DNA/RNA non-specific endonuclease, partial [Leuconostoc citreum]